MPFFDDSGYYLGPLGFCSHAWHEALIGLSEDGWKTTAAAAYPGPMCSFLAFLCVSSVRAIAAPQVFQTDCIPEAESFAAQLLQQDKISKGDLVHLFEILPHSAPRRDSLGSAGSAVTSGAYAHGKGIMGCRATCKSHPFSTEAFCRFIAQTDPEHCFTSFTVLDNVRSSVHKDSGNPASSVNLVVALSDFKDGQIWLEDPKGAVFREIESHVLPGRFLPVADGPQYLPAQSHWHATEPWVGRRLVVIAYSVGCPSQLTAQDRTTLCLLGFRLTPPASSCSQGGGSALLEASKIPGVQNQAGAHATGSGALSQASAQVTGSGAQAQAGAQATGQVQVHHRRQVHMPQVRAHYRKQVPRSQVQVPRLRQVHRPQVQVHFRRQVPRSQCQVPRLWQVHSPEVRVPRSNRQVHSPEVQVLRSRLMQVPRPHVHAGTAFEVRALLCQSH